MAHRPSCSSGPLEDAIGLFKTSEFLATPALGSLWNCSCKSQHFERTDERTRIADLISLRVIGHALQRFARACKPRISKPVSFLRLALRCTVLRSRWCQSGVSNARVLFHSRSRLILYRCLILVHQPQLLVHTLRCYHPTCHSIQSGKPSGLVWRPQVGELGKEVVVWPHFVLRHLPVRQEGEQGIGHIVGEQTAVVRVGNRARGIVWEDIR